MAAARTFDSVIRDLKSGHFAAVYYFTGDEDVLKDELITRIIDRALDPASRDFNLDVRSSADLNAESLHTLVETPPMLAERRVVIVRNLEQWRRNAKVWQVLDRYLSQPSPTTVLVLTHGPGQDVRTTIAHAAEHVSLEPLNPDELVAWIEKRARSAGFDIAPDAAQHLMGAVGTDLSALGMELDKLGAAAAPGQASVDLVSAMVGVRRGETNQDWVDAVLDRDVPRATSMLETVLASSGVTGVRLLSSLGTALVGVRIARAHLDAGKSVRHTQDGVFRALRTTRPPGVRSWKLEAQRWTQAARNWTAAELGHALRAAFDGDQALKSTTLTDERGILTYAILRMGPVEAAA